MTDRTELGRLSLSVSLPSSVVRSAASFCGIRFDRRSSTWDSSRSLPSALTSPLRTSSRSSKCLSHSQIFSSSSLVLGGKSTMPGLRDPAFDHGASSRNLSIELAGPATGRSRRPLHCHFSLSSSLTLCRRKAADGRTPVAPPQCCQRAIAKFLDCMCLAFAALGTMAP